MHHPKLLRYLSVTLLSVSLAALATSSCSLITDSDVAPSGIGAACSSDEDCQGTSCDDGACVAACSMDGDCPEPSSCFGGRCAVGDAVGQACETAADCQGAACANGICVTSCTDGTGSTECPGDSECLNTTCQYRLKVAGVWVGVVGTGEGWTLTHHEGIQEAQENLGYIDFDYKTELIGPSVADYIDTAITEGAEVIIANSFDHVPQVTEKAAQYPETTFLICSGKAKEPNLGSYFGNLEQAWYVAGQVAARKTKTKRLGFIGSYITPEVVRHLNAFTLGAKETSPDIKVEVRWIGFWYDPGFVNPQFEYTPRHMGDQKEKLSLTAEQYLTAKLIDSGADVIGHQCDNQYPSKYVAKHTEEGTLVDEEGNPKDVWTIANDNQFGWRDAAGAPYTNAIGAVYWNWGPMYTRLLDQIHRKQWTPTDITEPLKDDPSESIVGFHLSTGEKAIDDTVLQSLLSKAIEKGPEYVFSGPIATTGQRPGGDVPAGSYLAEGEYDSMCWFTEGVVERSNPNDPTSPDQPAKVPDDIYLGQLGDTTEPPPEGEPRQPTTAPEVLVSFTEPMHLMWNCKSNQILDD